MDYPCGFANILRTLKNLLVLSMNLIAFMVYLTAASGCKIDSMLKIGYNCNSIIVLQQLIYYTVKCSFVPQILTETSAKGIVLKSQ